MIKVGLVGEDPNDTKSLKLLLSKKYKNRIKFSPLLSGIKGSQLDTNKVKNSVCVEMKKNKCDFTLFIRDLDGFATQDDLVSEKTAWFDNLNKICGNKNIFLLNVWELEAMMFGDIDSFNKCYGTSLKGNSDPMMIRNPKAELMSATYKSKRKYEVSHCLEVFEGMDFDNVVKNCKFFSEFITKFDTHIADLS